MSGFVVGRSDFILRCHRTTRSFQPQSLRTRLKQLLLTCSNISKDSLHLFMSSDPQSPSAACAQQSLHHCTVPSITTTMDDEESRRLILSVQMDDLASVWASSTTSNDDAIALNADVSLGLYRQELRTAEQQIDDECAAQTAAQDEIRRRDAILADREAARRLFLMLNPSEPLPRMPNDGQLAIAESSILNKACLKAEPSPTPQPSLFLDEPSALPSFSLLDRCPALASTGTKRSASHFDITDEAPSKKKAVDDTSPAANEDEPAQTFAFTVSAPASRKRLGQNSDNLDPPMKRYKPSPSSENSHSTFGMTRPTPKIQWTSAVSIPVASSRESASLGFAWGNSPVATPESFRFGRPSDLGLGSTSGFHLPPKANEQDHTDPEPSEPQKLPASRQPIAPGQQPVIEQIQSSEVECVACCREVTRSESYSNSCSHVYCSKCINRLCKKAIRDDSLWPPQCCKAEMPLKKIEHLLGKNLLPLIQARQAEMNVPILERTYCVDCSAFIPPKTIHGKSALCYQCFESTCTSCKEKEHIGECQNKLEQDIRNLEALAEKEGWKKCSTCLMIIEHNTGCNHMT